MSGEDGVPVLEDFTGASREVLHFLRKRTGMTLWMVTRVAGDDWTVLTVDDGGYGVAAGDVLRWSDSFCWHMVQGRGPRIAPRSDDVPAYRDAPIGRQLPIRAYAGAPLTGPDGELFGTLCAIDKDEMPADLTAEAELLDLLSAMLGRILTLELQNEAADRRAERAEVDSRADSLTGIANRRGWEVVMAAEDARCARYGDPAGVVSIDLDGLKMVNDRDGHAAGDELIRRAAAALRSSVRDSDLVARVGGDEFAILFLAVDDAGLATLQSRVAEVLAAAGVPASLGRALRHPERGLQGAWADADAAMYVNKAARRGASRQWIGAPGGPVVR